MGAVQFAIFAKIWDALQFFAVLKTRFLNTVFFREEVIHVLPHFESRDFEQFAVIEVRYSFLPKRRLSNRATFSAACLSD
jgi:hypothetical protein